MYLKFNNDMQVMNLESVMGRLLQADSVMDRVLQYTLLSDSSLITGIDSCGKVVLFHFKSIQRTQCDFNFVTISVDEVVTLL